MYPLSDLQENNEEAYNQWLVQWLRDAREARGALGPPPAGAAELPVPPAPLAVTDGSSASGLTPTPASATVPLPPPEALYWKIVNSSEHAGKMAKSLSVGEGEDGDAPLLLHTVRIYSSVGVMQPVAFKRSDVENVTRETYDAWVAEVYGATHDEGADSSNPAKKNACPADGRHSR